MDPFDVIADVIIQGTRGVTVGMKGALNSYIIDNLAPGRQVNIEHLLDHPGVTFVEGSTTYPDFLMEMRWATGRSRNNRRFDSL